MPILRRLQEAKSANDIALILGYKPKSMAYILYGQPDEAKYRTFEIPKRSGGVRTISAPVDSLKLLQRRLADVLQECIQESTEKSKRGDSHQLASQMSHGFCKGHSVRTNARPHRHRNFVFNVDLQDFFGSINFGRVRGYFSANKSFSLDIKVATVLAQIACHKNSLPQGSPCSPVISNLIANILDVHVVRLAIKNGCTYTRYADDLSFSTNRRHFPPGIAFCSDSDLNRWSPGHDLVRIVNHSGFQINDRKTRMQYKYSRQEVTGLVVNKRINVPSEYRHRVRAMVHNLFTKGRFLVPCFARDQLGELHRAKTQGTLAQLHGRLGYIHSIDQLYYEDRLCNLASPKEMVNIIAARERSEIMYRRFLYFKLFYATTRPMILCEGKTDYIYIASALKSLFGRYLNSLLSIDSSKRVNYSFNTLKYSEGSTCKILKLRGGTGDLKTFVLNYRQETECLRPFPGMKHPVILVIDNDSGANQTISTIKEILKLEKGESVDRDASFIHVCLNLYLVLTPRVNKSMPSKIEDLFHPETLAIKLDGRSFSAENDYDSKQHYGKETFSKEIIVKQLETIDFSGFIPLLDRIQAAIYAHALQRKGPE